MGIVNINDDSFSGDGTLDASEALKKAQALIAEGADIIDIGAESARTNREAISVEEEVRRLRSFLTAWSGLQKKPADAGQLFPTLLSVNTWRPEVVAQIIGDQVDILNDMSALPDDRNARLCARHGVALLIMHSVGQPKVAHTQQQWPDLMGSMTSFFGEKIASAQAAGLSAQQIILDPGLDFAKQKDDNLLLLKELHRIIAFGCPVLLPISRKTVIGDVLDLPNPNDRDPGTIALLTHGLMQGTHIFRVHNVRACREALKVLTPFIPGSLKIVLNFALTADGKISTTSKSPAHFTSKADLDRLHEIRSQADAILVGRGTLEADQMSLTTPAKSPGVASSPEVAASIPVTTSSTRKADLATSSPARRPGFPISRQRFIECRSKSGWKPCETNPKSAFSSAKAAANSPKNCSNWMSSTKSTSPGLPIPFSEEKTLPASPGFPEISCPRHVTTDSSRAFREATERYFLSIKNVDGIALHL